jgi:hypothetical protein
MGHAAHFLSRLDRLDLEQEELALALYRDPALVKAVLIAAEVPEGPDRIALAIADGDAPPHIVVERDGAFVTCLGAKMAIHAAHLIPHAKLRAIQDGVATVRAAFLAARGLSSGGSRTIERLGARMFSAGSMLTAEEMRAAVAISPIWSTSIPETLGELLKSLDESRAELLSWKAHGRWAHTERGEAKLKHLWQTLWSISHFCMLLPTANPARVLRDFPTIDMGLACLIEAVHSGHLPVVARVTWALARLGLPMLERLEQLAAEKLELDRIQAPFAMAVLGATHPELRARALAWLRRERPPDDLPGILSVALGNATCQLLAKGLAEPADQDELLLALSRAVLWDFPLWRTRWAAPEHIPASIARPFITLTSLDLYDDGGSGIAVFVNSLPWLARAEAPDLFLAEAEQPQGEPFGPKIGLRILGGLGRFEGKRRPVRAEGKPGRNEPCPCGSGKKSKRCCAA